MSCIFRRWVGFQFKKQQEKMGPFLGFITKLTQPTLFFKKKINKFEYKQWMFERGMSGAFKLSLV